MTSITTRRIPDNIKQEVAEELISEFPDKEFIIRLCIATTEEITNYDAEIIISFKATYKDIILRKLRAYARNFYILLVVLFPAIAVNNLE